MTTLFRKFGKTKRKIEFQEILLTVGEEMKICHIDDFINELIIKFVHRLRLFFFGYKQNFWSIGKPKWKIIEDQTIYLLSGLFWIIHCFPQKQNIKSFML